MASPLDMAGILGDRIRKGRIQSVVVPPVGRQTGPPLSEPGGGLNRACHFVVLAAVSLGLVSPPAHAVDISAEVRSGVDRQLFTGTVGLDAKVFKNNGPITVRLMGPSPLSEAETTKVQSVVSLVSRAYQEVLPYGILRSAPSDDQSKKFQHGIFFVNRHCDILCRNKLADRLNARLNLLVEFKDDGGWPVCVAKSPVDGSTGEILAALAVVDVSVSDSELTWCLLQALNTMLSRSDGFADISFAFGSKKMKLTPEEIVREYFEQIGKVESLRFLYNPTVKPGMSRDEFWKVVTSLP